MRYFLNLLKLRSRHSRLLAVTYLANNVVIVLENHLHFFLAVVIIRVNDL